MCNSKSLKTYINDLKVSVDFRSLGIEVSDAGNNVNEITVLK